MTEMDEYGPVDYVVVEFPAGRSTFDGSMAKELASLVDRGLIRILDLLVIQKGDDGSVEGFEIDDLEAVDEIRQLEAQVGEILAEEDVAHLDAEVDSGGTWGGVVWGKSS